MEEGKQGRAEISPLSQPKQNIAGRVEQMKYLKFRGQNSRAAAPWQGHPSRSDDSWELYLAAHSMTVQEP